MSRILIFNPYLPVLGGGERYVYFLAQALADRNDVVIAGPKVDDSRLAELGFDITIPRLELASRDYTSTSAEFDSAFFLTNEIPRPSRARKSVLIVQFPYQKLATWRHPRLKFRQHRSLATYEQAIVYSKFSQEWTRRRWRLDSEIVAPPVTPGRYSENAKQPLILAVGRFFTGGHSKRQDLLIDAFIQLEKRLDAKWQLVLVGGCYDDSASKKYLSDLRARIVGHRITILQDLPAPKLTALYESATLFWHAAGYGRRSEEPETAEHFGMTTVEAMSYGAVPLVYPDGGQAEVVNETHGRLWRSVDELISQSIKLINGPNELHEAATASVAAAEKYSFENFTKRLKATIRT